MGRVAQCISAWVEEGITIRDLTLRECIAARSMQSRLQEPFPASEIPGVVFEAPAASQAATQREQRLASEANAFAAGFAEGLHERPDS